MSIPESALNLAGFALAQAVRDISILPEDDALCPFAIVEQSGKRILSKFENPKFEAAITNGKDAMAQASKTADAWAFAREDYMQQGKDAVDAISIDFWTRGMPAPSTLFQRFELTGGRGKIHLIGDPGIVIDSVVQDPDEAQDLVRHVMQGIVQHRQNGPLTA